MLINLLNYKEKIEKKISSRNDLKIKPKISVNSIKETYLREQGLLINSNYSKISFFT